jgi:hypothetical protein
MAKLGNGWERFRANSHSLLRGVEGGKNLQGPACTNPKLALNNFVLETNHLVSSYFVSISAEMLYFMPFLGFLATLCAQKKILEQL